MGSCCYILGNLEEFMAMTQLFCPIGSFSWALYLPCHCELFQHQPWSLCILSGSWIVVSVLNLLLHGDFIGFSLSPFFFISLFFIFSWDNFSLLIQWTCLLLFNFCLYFIFMLSACRWSFHIFYYFFLFHIHKYWGGFLLLVVDVFLHPFLIAISIFSPLSPSFLFFPPLCTKYHGCLSCWWWGRIILEAKITSLLMASASCVSKSPLPMKDAAAASGYCLYPPPLARYEEVANNPKLFMSTLEKLHASMGTKFM